MRQNALNIAILSDPFEISWEKVFARVFSVRIFSADNSRKSTQADFVLSFLRIFPGFSHFLTKKTFLFFCHTAHFAPQGLGDSTVLPKGFTSDCFKLH